MKAAWHLPVLLLLVVLAAPAGARDDDEEDAEGTAVVEPMSAMTLQAYQEAMQAQILPLLTAEPSDARFQGCRALPYSGLTAPALFDRLDQSLLREYETAV